MRRGLSVPTRAPAGSVVERAPALAADERVARVLAADGRRRSRGAGPPSSARPSRCGRRGRPSRRGAPRSSAPTNAPSPQAVSGAWSSPAVRTMTSSTATPRRLEGPRDLRDWTSASALPRVPSRRTRAAGGGRPPARHLCEPVTARRARGRPVALARPRPTRSAASGRVEEPRDEAVGHLLHELALLGLQRRDPAQEPVELGRPPRLGLARRWRGSPGRSRASRTQPRHSAAVSATSLTTRRRSRSCGFASGARARSSTEMKRSPSSRCSRPGRPAATTGPRPPGAAPRAGARSAGRPATGRRRATMTPVDRGEGRPGRERERDAGDVVGERFAPLLGPVGRPGRGRRGGRPRARRRAHRAGAHDQDGPALEVAWSRPIRSRATSASDRGAPSRHACACRPTWSDGWKSRSSTGSSGPTRPAVPGERDADRAGRPAGRAGPPSRSALVVTGSEAVAQLVEDLVLADDDAVDPAATVNRWRAASSPSSRRAPAGSSGSASPGSAGSHA